MAWTLTQERTARVAADTAERAARIAADTALDARTTVSGNTPSGTS